MLFRIIYVHCHDIDIVHAGPILYLTERNGGLKKLRPYTREEAENVVKRYNSMGDKVFHEVVEV